MTTETKGKNGQAKLAGDKYFSLIEHAADGIAIIQDGVFKLVNTALIRISGYDEEELLGMPFTQILTPQSQEITMARYQARIAGKKVPKIYEIQAITKDGAILDIEINAALTEYEGRVADEIIVRDITERKVKQKEYQSIIHTTTDGFWIVDNKGRFLDVNNAYCALTGYSREELLNMSIPDIEAVETLEYTDRHIQQIIKTGHARFETRHRCKDGRILDIEISTTYAGAGDDRLFVFARDITERKQAEQTLADEATRRRILIDQSRDGIVILDQDGKVYEANQQFAEMLGYTPEEVRQLSVLDWEYLFPREQVLEMVRTVDEAGDHFETKHRRKDGSTYDVEISTNGAVIAGQKLIFCVCRDITERKKAEQQLQEKHEQLDSQNEELRAINEELRATEEELQHSQERLERMFESITDGIIVTALDGTILKVNERSAQMHGFASEDDMLGRKAFDLVAPQDHERIAADIRKTLKEGTIRGGEYTMIRVDGTEFPGELSTSVLKDGRGNMIGHISIARDITYRKQMEELFKTVTNSSPVGIYILQDGKFQLANPQFQKLTGYSEEELSKIDSTTLVLSEDRDKVRKKAVKMLEGKLSSPYQFRVTNKAGETRWVIETVTSILYRGRQATLGNYIDITERKQAEEREDQLQQELNLAGRLASIGQLAAGVAHEINNPLTGVIGFSHLMLSRDIPEDMKQDLQVIHSEAQRVAKIVENLLVFAHQRKTGREYVALNDIITRVLELRAYEMKVNNIEVENQLDPDLPLTMADAGQLQQVFLNIVLNAEHFITKVHNKGKLLVKTEKIDGNIRASFTDDGVGISRENLDKIFNPFFTTKEVGKGTGLGLSICHGIITQHKGRIYAQSELGKGATFVIELPIVAEPVQAGKARVTQKEPQKPRGAKILVVDDEAAILTFLNRLLTDMGHSVETINNADTALERLNTERYSLILLDIKLPGMSGIELYHHIEEIAPALTRRVMFITGDVMEGATRGFMEKTGAPYITKPIDIEELKKIMNSILTGGAQRLTA